VASGDPASPQRGPFAPAARSGRHRALIAIIGASLALKLVLLVPAHQTIPVRDAADYVSAAQTLYVTGSYRSGRTPLYPATIAAAMWLASVRGEHAVTIRLRPEARRPPVSDLDIVRLVQVVMSTVTVWLVYLLGCELFDRRAGIVAAGLFAFYPPFVAFSHLLWAETQFTLLNVAWMLLLVRGVRTRQRATLCVCGIAFALAAMTRLVVFSFLPLAVAWMFVVKPQAWRATARLAAALLLGAVLTLAPWTIRNAFVYRAFVPIVPGNGLALLWGASPDITAEMKATGLDRTHDVAERTRLARRRTLEIIRADPGAYVRRVLTRNLPGMWTAGSMVLEIDERSGTSLHHYPPIPRWLGRSLIVVFVAAYLGVILFAVLGGALGADWRTTLLFLGLALHATALHALASGFDRHRLYVMAFAIPYAAFALSRRPGDLADLVTRRRALVALGVLALVSLLIASGDYRSLSNAWRVYAA
jgi:4-amino-4-deoxy-L-arabinose transferase-like glycosyltransferase